MTAKWLALALVAGALTACASSSGRGVDGDLSIGPGGRAVGRIPMPPRVETKIELVNEGPGIADFRITTRAGTLIQSGSLGQSETRYQSHIADELVVAIMAVGERPVVIDYRVRSAVGADIVWDLERALSPEE